MATYTVAEIAARTGFSPSAVRYYDQRGLVPASARSGAGYRLYDERSVERLDFVARAKRLGLRLDDVADLLHLWDGEECEPVQSRLAELVRARLAETHARIAELRTFASELAALRERFEQRAHAGPCDESCACLDETHVDGADVHTPPASCTLEADARPQRIAEWRSVIDRAEEQAAIEGGMRLTLPGTPEVVAHVARLAAAEQQCCAFLTFRLTLVDGDAQLEVTAPAGAAELVAGLFGVADFAGA